MLVEGDHPAAPLDSCCIPALLFMTHTVKDSWDKLKCQPTLGGIPATQSAGLNEVLHLHLIAHAFVHLASAGVIKLRLAPVVLGLDCVPEATLAPHGLKLVDSWPPVLPSARAAKKTIGAGGLGDPTEAVVLELEGGCDIDEGEAVADDDLGSKSGESGAGLDDAAVGEGHSYAPFP